MANQHARVALAQFPSAYGVRGGEADEPLDWEQVEQLLRQAQNYWVTTITPDRRPHARPVDGVWVDGALCFGGSPETRWVRNLGSDPSVSVHLPSGDEVVILDGTAVYVTDPLDPLAALSTVASKTKYPQYFPRDSQPPFRPFWSLRPAVVYAWKLEGFPNRATRWTFDR